MRKCASDINDHKAKMLANYKPPSLMRYILIHLRLTRLFPKKESANDWILRGMIYEFEILLHAIHLFKEAVLEYSVLYGEGESLLEE
ncbi:MAG: hypothetical protein PHU42_02240 [Patescibacteria group bacterium]|nr:hypothetical protein [Patescibacteria group bacterium]